MGLDVNVYFKTKHKSWDNAKTLIGEVEINDNEDAKEATHVIYSLMRYYSEDYARGNWPCISAVLMELLADPKIENVWYQNDHYDELGEEFTKERLLELTEFYIKNQDRPYREYFK